jgi:hypothetical protein
LETIPATSSTKAALMEVHYLPPLEFFTCLLKYSKLHLEQHEYYQKQTFRNRCLILASNKIDTLSVPVQDGRSKILVRDLRIEYRQDWVRRHWGAIQSAYGKSAYFEFYAEPFERALRREPAFLLDLNSELLTICLDFLKIDKTKLQWTERYESPDYQHTEDLRSLITPKQSYQTRTFYQAVPYRQTFGNDFEPNLSIIDLLFCQGPRAKSLLEQSVKN